MGLFTSNCPGCGADINWFLDVPVDYVCACERPVSPEEIEASHLENYHARLIANGAARRLPDGSLEWLK